MISNSEDIAVSIICLAYNHEKYIRQTLEGFVNQITTFKYEIIIHEDASTDGTRDIIEEYVEKYPDLFVPIFQKENQYSKGSAHIHKIIYQKIRGKFIAFCEGDDYWCDCNKLQTQYDIMEQHPECSICVHRVDCVNEDGSDNAKTFPESEYGLNEGVVEKEKICEVLWKKGSYPFHTSGYFIRREIHDERISLYGKDDWVDYVNGDIIILWLSLYRGVFYYIEKAMSRRRLEVPGSYNDRLKKISAEEKYDIWINRIKGLHMYDKYSQQEFHSYIQFRLVNVIFRRMRIDLNHPVAILKECGISHRDVFRYAKIRDRFIYVVLYFFPSAVFGIRSLLRKLRN